MMATNNESGPSSEVVFGQKTIAELLLLKCDNFQNVKLKAQVVERSEITAYSTADGKQRRMFTVSLVDPTSCIKGLVYSDTFFLTMQKDASILLMNFLPKGDHLIITAGSKVFKCGPASIPVPDEVLARARMLLGSRAAAETLSVENLTKSPVKSRVNVRGKITKLSPCKTTTVRHNGQRVSLRNLTLKDTTGSIEVSLWRDQAHTPLELGEVISMSNASVGFFRKAKILQTCDKTKIENIQDSTLKELETDDDDDDHLDEIQSASMQHQRGHIIGVSNIAIYKSCSRNGCYLKKLVDDACPNCQTRFTEDTCSTGIAADLAIEASTGIILEAKAFRQMLIKILNAKLPGETFLHTKEQIEQQVLSVLPLEVTFEINCGRILTYVQGV